MNNTARRIREAREHKGWSQTELARRSGLHRNSIAAWEKGIRTPGPAHLKLLELILERSLRVDKFVLIVDEGHVTDAVSSATDGTLVQIDKYVQTGGE